jgi:light-harvesting complex I chlorophyll a/b binding protein 3
VGQLALMGFAEIRRFQDYRLPGSQAKQYFLGLESGFKGSGVPAYPGGQFFNFANYGKTPEELATMKTKEIKNGRLAMLAMMGYFTQGAFTHASPIDNLVAHLSNPTGANILTTFGNVSQ